MSTNAGYEEREWKGRTGPFTYLLNPGVFAPTHTSRTIADTLEIEPADTVIDVGCGSGVLSFVAARLGAGRVIGCDISEEAVKVARENARRLGLEDRVEFRVGSLLDPVRGERASVIIGDVSGIPDEIAQVSGWFPDGRAGGPTGSELPAAMLESIHENDCLAPGGRLYLPTGTIQAENRILEVARRIFGAANLQALKSREFPLPDVVAKSKAVARMMKEGILDLHARGSRLLWRLQVWRCELPAVGGSGTQLTSG
ncbi:MAG TPA: methyltransferase domain-containing protein [Actinomycetota bacterium]|jgi:SAM-dependent methyltransferase|nr:methyltransferase domain-containing protein [Actinomycetota bacterium]